MKTFFIKIGVEKYLEFEMWRHFDTEQKSFTLFDCVDCMVYPDPKFLIFKIKKWPHFFSVSGG